MKDKPITYRRSELYEQVWAEPVRTVAKRYGVSDVALAKMCRRLAVPLPERGHWMKKQAGKASPQPPLPPLPEGAPAEVTVAHTEYTKPAIPPEAQAFVDEESKHEALIVVSPALEEPHRLVSMAAKLLRKQKADSRDGLVSCRSERCLDIRVSPERLERALRIMDTLIKALEKRELHVEVTEVAKYSSSYNRVGDGGIEPNSTGVRVDGEWLTFGITERLTTEEPKPPNGLSGEKLSEWRRWHSRRVFVPKGALQLAIKDAERYGTRVVWKDGKRRVLEDCLNDFVAKLHVEALAKKNWRAEREERQRREMEAQHRRWEEDRRAKDVQEQLDRWRAARDYRAYVEEARKIVADAGCHFVEGSELDESLKWALRHADAIDPLSSLRREVAQFAADRAKKEEASESSKSEGPHQEPDR